MKPYAHLGALILAGSALASAPDVREVNGPIRVEAGRLAGDVSTVNGSIQIGDRARVGGVRTINGGITLGRELTAASVEAVNGAVHVGGDDRIAGAVRTINGSITLDASADVAGRVASVNGALRLNAAHVGGGLETTNGNIEVGAQSRVEGGMRVGKVNDGWLDWLLHGWFQLGDRPRIVIGPGAVVKGTLRFERDVTLYVSDRATIDAIRGATAIRYSGRSPALERGARTGQAVVRQ